MTESLQSKCQHERTAHIRRYVSKETYQIQGSENTNKKTYAKWCVLASEDSASIAHKRAATKARPTEWPMPHRMPYQNAFNR